MAWQGVVVVIGKLSAIELVRGHVRSIFSWWTGLVTYKVATNLERSCLPGVGFGSDYCQPDSARSEVRLRRPLLP
jgi:hypothetical protein